MPASGPTVARRQLGKRLTALREAAGVTTQQVEDAKVAGRKVVSKPTLWRIETGQQRVSEATVKALCRLYGVGPDETEALEQLARQTADRGLWHEYRDIVPQWFKLYVDLEAVATTIFSFDDSIVPGELQTPAYAWAVWHGARPELDDEAIAPHVELRLQRQRAMFKRVPAPRLDVVVGENVLHRRVGSPAVMAEQIERLHQLNREPHIDIRYLPFAAGAHPGTSGPYRILRFEDPHDPDVVYVELEVCAYYRDKEEDLRRYRQISAELTTRAVPIDEFKPVTGR